MVGPTPSSAMAGLAAHLRLLIATATPEIARIAPGRPHWDADLRYMADLATGHENGWLIYASVPQTIVLHLQSNGLALDIDTSGWRPAKPEFTASGKGHFALISTFIDMLFNFTLDPLET